MAGALGTIRGQMVLDVRQAISAFTAARLANLQTVTAMRSGAGALTSIGVGMTAIGVGLLAGIKVAIDAAADFERRLDFFGSVSAATAEQMDQVRQKALDLGRDTIYSAGQIADSFVELGKAGVSAQDIIDGIGEGVTNLGAAADIPLDQAAKIMMAAVQTFHLGAGEAVRVADLLAGAANASIVEVEDLGVSLKYAGGVAASLGLPLEDVVDALGLLGTYGIRGSTAGTSLRQILVSLGGATKKATNELKSLGIITEDGKNKFFDAAGSAKPLAEIFQILQDATAGMGDEARLAALKTIFQNRALASAIALTNEGTQGFADMNAEIHRTTAMEVASKRLDNLSGDVELLKGNLQTLAIEQGGQLQEFMRGVVQGITRLVQAFANLDPSTQQFILRAIAVTGIVMVVVGIFGIFAGAIMNIVALFIQLGPVFKLLFGGLKIVIAGFRLLAVAMLTNPVGLIITGIIALVAAFIYLWNNVEGFRNFFIGVWDWIKNAAAAALAWFQSLPEWFSGVWNGITEGATNGWNAVLDFFRSIPGMIADFFMNWTLLGLLIQHWDTITATIHTAWDGVLNFFKALPGRMAAFFAALPGLIGYWIGFMIGRAIRLLWDFSAASAAVVRSGWAAIITFFSELPGKIGDFFYQMFWAVVNWLVDLNARVYELCWQMQQNIEQFFRELPGRVGDFFSQLWRNVVNWMNRTAESVGNAVIRIFNSLVEWFGKLPGRVGAFFSQLAATIGRWMTDAWSTATRLATTIGDGVINGIKGLPGLVSGIFQKVVKAIKDEITGAFNAVKDFASGLWEGFKDGLGIHSPSFIERAMWQIMGVVTDEANHLARAVPKIQALGSQLDGIGNDTNSYVGDYVSTAVGTLADQMAKMQALKDTMQNMSSSIQVATRVTGASLAATAGSKYGAQNGPVTIDKRQYIDVDVDAPQNMSPDQVGKMVASRVSYAVTSNTTPIPTPASVG